MFKSVRIKLTLWYVAIIVLICLILSLPTYQVMVRELERRVHISPFRIGFGISEKNTFDMENKIIREIKEQVVLRLLLINLGIVIGSGFIAYFLAGKTLFPIEKMMEEQKQFVADASHELRTPLTAIKTGIEVALRDRRLKLSDAKKSLVSNLEEINKMQALSNYLLSLGRYQDGSLENSQSQIDLAEVIENTIKKTHVLAKAKHITVIKEIEPVKLNGNRDSLMELTTILLDNAIKYSGENSQIYIWVKKSGKTVKIEVQDFGIGIKQTDLPHIFNRFYRADMSRHKSKTDGYGLGLAIAKSIADLYQGKIETNSKINQGSTFTVILPLS